MPVLILFLNLLFVRVNGSFTGVELRVSSGPRLMISGTGYTTERAGDTLKVNLRRLINPMGFLEKPVVNVVVPEGSTVDLFLSIGLSKVVLDMSKLSVNEMALDLKMSKCDIVLPLKPAGDVSIYSFASKIRVINAQSLSRRSFFKLSGGRVFIEASAPVHSKLTFSSDGARINFKLPSRIKLTTRGLVNVTKISSRGNRGLTEISVIGNFNVIRIM